MKKITVKHVGQEGLEYDETQLFYEPEEAPVYSTEGAIPLEAKKGTVIVFSGDFVHYSYHNHSDKPRHAFTMHVVEGRNTKWESDNWLTRNDVPFRLMNSVAP